jgi:hypothetical protein
LAVDIPAVDEFLHSDVRRATAFALLVDALRSRAKS